MSHSEETIKLLYELNQELQMNENAIEYFKCDFKTVRILESQTVIMKVLYALLNRSIK